MDDLLEQLIADFHERKLPGLTRRHLQLPWLPGKIDTVIGMRRSGKTWFLYQMMGDLQTRGYPKEALLYLNFEDERLLPLNTADLHRITDVYYRRYPYLRERPCAFFFDEIQEAPGWERFVRRLLDTEDIHLCLTGSSARLLGREIATGLRGRALSTEVFPFSFKEALAHAGIHPPAGQCPGAKMRALLENRMRAYLLEGGFPEVQSIAPEYRIRILQGYLDVVILRDIVERHNISGTVALRALIRQLVNNPGGLFSTNKFYNDLKSQGIAVSKNTLHEYLEYLTDSYLFFPVFIHSRSERARRVNPRKIYTIDTGLATACIRRPHPDLGYLLENLVYLELRRRGYFIEYYKTAGGEEVDFLATDPAGERILIQVCLDIDEPATRKREINALLRAMPECGLNRSVLITLNQKERIDCESNIIDAIPVWLWCLS
ncbi:MAG: ATP-binding protein [Gammaproteobacteria bacterium]|nr:ATP-binding protein [Gammaproteobacteria bacterium]